MDLRGSKSSILTGSRGRSHRRLAARSAGCIEYPQVPPAFDKHAREPAERHPRTSAVERRGLMALKDRKYGISIRQCTLT